MEKVLKDKSLLLGIVTLLQFVGVIKERASNFKISKDNGSRIFFDELMKNHSYLHNLWTEYFSNEQIYNFSGKLIKYTDIAYKIAFGMPNNSKINVSKNIKTHLTHLISQVTLKEKTSNKKQLPFKKFSYESIFPVYNKDYTNELQYYDDTYNCLVKEVEKILVRAEKDDNLLEASAALDSLFFEYLSNIPAYLSDDGIVDISFYEYAKLIAALTSVCYIQDEKNCFNKDNNFTLIRGDFFSIQQFIFNKDIANKNPAKSLRGKSFYVSLLSDIASFYILDELGLPYFNIMINAAGQFVIIAFNNNDSEESLNKVKTNISDWLYKNFYCSISMELSITICSEKQFMKEEFNKLILNMLYQKDVAKFTQFNLVERKDFIFKDYYRKFDKSTTLCSYCGTMPATKKYPADDKQDICEQCYKYVDLGEKLTKSEYINIYNDNKGIFYKYEYSLDTEPIKDAVHRIHINLHNSNNINYNSCNVIHYKAYVVHDENNNICSFNEIAKFGSGAEILAVLKADVDNLGLIFSAGLSKKDNKFNIIENHITFSKMNMLSRSIHNFFSYYLFYLMYEKKLNVYTVFAGGDDLFIVGKYSDIVKLAKIINEHFYIFTGKNKEITISAGIGLFNFGTPIWIMADETEKLLEEAKHRNNNDIYKGNISILYTSCNYNDFIKEHNEFYERFLLLDNNEINLSKSFYYKIMEFCDMEKEFQENKSRLNNLLWRPRLYYTLTNANINKDIRDQLLEYLTSKIQENPSLIKSLLALRLYDLRKKDI